MPDKPREPQARGQFSADDPSSPQTTIVGGQPPSRLRRTLKGVPVGMERALLLAASDPDFRQALAEDAGAAVARWNLELRPSELAMLRAIPADQLEATIAGLDITPQNLQRRRFLRSVAAGVATLAAADAMLGCDGDDDPLPPDQGVGADAGVRQDGSPYTPDQGWLDQKVDPPQEGGMTVDAGVRSDGGK